MKINALLLALLAPLCAAVACQSPSSGTFASGSSAELAPLAGVPHRYLSAFEALRRTLEVDEDQSAAAMLNRLQRRIDLDAGREDGLIARHRRENRPGPPPLRTTARAQEVAEGFRRILAGRERIGALTLRLYVRHADQAPDQADGGEQPSTALMLIIESHWPTDLILEPGPATLRYSRTAIGADGHEMHSVGTQSLEVRAALIRIEVPAGEQVAIELTPFRLLLSEDSIGLRTRWSLAFLAGSLLDGEEDLPARTLPVDGIEWISLAPFLPSGPVEPAELLRYACEEHVRTPNLIERAIRIPVARHEETLDLFGASVDRFSDPELRTLAPALRWLADRTGPQAGTEQWRRWLGARSQEAESFAGEKSKLSLPSARR